MKQGQGNTNNGEEKEKEKEKDKKVSPQRQASAAVLSSIIATTLLQPLDVLKTRLQVQEKERIVYNEGLFKSLRQIAKTEGIRGLYAGLTPSLIGNPIAWGLYFGGYRLLMRDSTSALEQTRAAALSGLFTQMVTNPIWVIKSRMELQQRNTQSADTNYKNIFHAGRVIFKEEGARGFYAGFVLSVFNNIHGVVQLVSYERLRLLVLKFNGEENDGKKLGLIPALVTGALSKVIAQLVTYPISTVRTRVQQRPGHGLENKSAIKVVVSMWRKDRFAGFYRGALVATARVIPHSAIIFALMEQIMYFTW